jgi:hypothetical protein
MFCTQCGTRLPVSAAFCHSCGAAISSAAVMRSTPASARTRIVIWLVGAAVVLGLGGAGLIGGLVWGRADDGDGSELPASASARVSPRPPPSPSPPATATPSASATPTMGATPPPSATTTGTPPIPAPTLTATPTTTAAPEELPSLEATLAGGEVLMAGSVARPNLVYALKEGRHVMVLVRNISTGDEREVLEYNESIEAEHSGNTWQELPPSVALSPAAPMLVYVAEGGLMAFHIGDKTSATLLRHREGGEFADLTTYRWVSDAGAELCCGFHLAEPVISQDGTSLAISVSQYEGSTLAVVRVDGSAACEVGDRVSSLYPVWRPQTGDLLIPSGGEYAAVGLFVSSPADLCSSHQIASAPPGPTQLSAGFAMGSWSPDGQWVAASLWEFDGPTSLLLVRSDGTESRTLVAEGLNLWPVFSTDGRSVYFLHRLSRDPQSAVSLRRIDLGTGQTESVVDIPVGWSVRPQGWTDEGHLMLHARSTDCPDSVCVNRLVLLDATSARTVYAGPSSDFTRFLGFLPQHGRLLAGQS